MIVTPNGSVFRVCGLVLITCSASTCRQLSIHAFLCALCWSWLSRRHWCRTYYRSVSPRVRNSKFNYCLLHIAKTGHLRCCLYMNHGMNHATNGRSLEPCNTCMSCSSQSRKCACTGVEIRRTMERLFHQWTAILIMFVFTHGSGSRRRVQITRRWKLLLQLELHEEFRMQASWRPWQGPQRNHVFATKFYCVIASRLCMRMFCCRRETSNLPCEEERAPCSR